MTRTSSAVIGLQVEKILRSPVFDSVASLCQCWSSDGCVFATTHDRRVTFYSATDAFRIQLSVQLRFIVTSMDIARQSSGGGDDSRQSAYLLAVGTAFGAHLYRVELSTQPTNQEDNAKVEPLAPLASAYEEIPICHVKFSHDGATIALGSVDGRLYIQALVTRDGASQLSDAFGTQVVAKVLAAPRVTSMSFSPCDRRLAVATRKGNVYVLTQVSLSGEWQQHLPCQELTSNPKPVATRSSSSAAITAMQTLVCWWSAAVLVVASRAANYRLEMVDVKSGKLLHTLQILSQPAANDGDAASAATDDHLLTGICCVQLSNGHAKLVCHDTASSVSTIMWPLLELESVSSLHL